MNTICLLLFIAVMVFLICFSIFALTKQRNKEKQLEKERERKAEYNKGLISMLNDSKFVNTIIQVNNTSNIEKIFNRSKNPWNMTVATFQFVRYGGLILGLVIAIIFLPINKNISLLMIIIGALFIFYPLYYYTAIGNEREAEWNKMYEFVWVIKHNIMLYDPAKAYMNTRMYIQEHAPHNKEIIQGFEDFYKYWNNEEIDEYIKKYYSFSVPREITQIIFNMNKTGDFPEDSLNALRNFIINAQNLTVEKTLSTVSGKATVFSLPFMMFSVILVLMIPMGFQLLQYF